MISLLALIEEHREAIEADLIDRGLRLRDVGGKSFTWRDLLVIVRQSKRDSALFRAMHPNEHQWGVTELLQAQTVDLLSLLVWFKTKDGQKGRNRPDPVPRPGVEPRVKKRHVKGEALPIDQLRKRLGMSERHGP